MFESLKLKHEIDKVTFKAEAPKLRGALVDTQMDLLEAGDFPVIVLLAGLDTLGRSATAKQLLSWLDPRHVRNYALIRPSAEERSRPRMWRYWRALPRKGRIGLFLNSWYEEPVSRYILGEIDRDQLIAHVEEICRFERMLADDGALILKFMFLLPSKGHLKEMKKLQRRRAAAWKLSAEEIKIGEEFARDYAAAVTGVEALAAATSTASAPWLALPSADARYRDLTAGRTIVQAIRRRLDEGQAPPAAVTGVAGGGHGPNLLGALDLGQALNREDYRAGLKREQRRMIGLTLSRKFEKRSLVAVFEGNDAAGKGGSIRRVAQALDPRMYRVIPVAAPNDEEQAQPYLWRFWRHVPRRGQIAIFDRSWYGRVLVERVEGFCSEAEWMRAYREIREFEAELTAYGVIVVKFWLSIDKEEQLRRFKEREEIGYKRYKITEEDWRNRDKWDAYAAAVHDMVERTGAASAPWTLVEANDKYFARVKVLQTINDRLKAEL